MAIEAVRQMSTKLHPDLRVAGFFLRKITSALQIPVDDIGIDTWLEMRSADSLKDETAVDWWHFSISSVPPNSNVCIEHCIGQICVETAKRTTRFLVSDRPHLRRIALDGWYKKFAEHGI